MKSLFSSKQEPQVSLASDDDVPAPGPNAVEVAVFQYDPDQNLLVVSLPGDVQAVYALSDMQTDGSTFTLQLQDSKLGPRVNVEVIPRTLMPRFSSPEEADAWLEANA